MKRLFSSCSRIAPPLKSNNNNTISIICEQTQQRFVRSVANTDVIIKKDFKFLVEGEVAKVKAGYMRNYLYPNKIAIYATESNLKELNDRLTPEMKIAIQEKKRHLLKQNNQGKTLLSGEEQQDKEESFEEISEEQEEETTMEK